MKSLGFWMALILLGLGLAVAAEVPGMGPGGFHLKGATDESGGLELTLRVRQTAPEQLPILAVKVYTEPSHTLQYALVDENATVGLLMDVRLENPQALSIGPVADSESRATVALPPEADWMVRVDCLVAEGEGYHSVTRTVTSVSSVSDFEFMVDEPDGGGHIRICGYCGEELCGCISCPSLAHTVCCPICTITCGIIQCP